MELITYAGLFGTLAFLMGIWRLQLKDHRSVMLADIPVCAFWTIHFMFLGGISGAIINALAFFRGIARCYMSPQKFTYIIYFITVCIWVFSLYFYQNFYSLLPPIGSTIATYGVLSSCRRVLTNCLLIHYIFWFWYGIGIDSIPMCLSVTTSTISCLIGKYRHENRRATDKQHAKTKLKNATA